VRDRKASAFTRRIWSNPAVPLYAYLLLAAMVAGALAGSLWAVLALSLLGAVWLIVNAPFEGPVLVTLVPRRHGITTADLVSVAAFGLAVAALVRR
jgi:hypothetical protein